MPDSENTPRFGALVSVFIFLLAALLAAPVAATAGDCAVSHPLDPPDARFTGQCPNCGMTRGMWARTWYAFENADGKHQVCSLHCLADISRKSGHVPKQVQVALYLSPEVSVPAASAVFVVGSRARGTMTRVSKLAFVDRSSAEEFAAACGGKVTTWLEAYSMALAGLSAENAAITQMRLKKGKIVVPKDRVDTCVVCGMYPARYERSRAQVRTVSGSTVHFCSTQCLFKYLKDPRRYEADGADPQMIWVADHASGRWISAATAYFVIHSEQWGPMGYEAFAFDDRATADAFVGRNGGQVLPFSEVRIEQIMSGD
jgi:nitrous oxide reductase accessory protein NosL